METGKTSFEKIRKKHELMVLNDGSTVLKIDRRWCHEITTPIGITDAEEKGIDVVADPNTVYGMPDHVNPPKDPASALQTNILRMWCKKHGCRYYKTGCNGICHALIAEQGLILPGETGLMGDSHTGQHGSMCAITIGVGTTELMNSIRTKFLILRPQKVIKVNIIGNPPANVYAKDIGLECLRRIGLGGATNCVVEYGGEVIERMPMNGRQTISNLTAEVGGTCGMMAVDMTTIDYLWPVIQYQFSSKEEALNHYLVWNSDSDAIYERTYEIDVTNLVPMTTHGYRPTNGIPVADLARKNTIVHQVAIGGCTNGRIDDLRVAAAIFKKYGKIHEAVECIVLIATSRIFEQAVEEGLVKIFKEVGCFVSEANCGPCLGMSNGVLAEGRVCFNTFNRNYKGRMGKWGIIYLGSPASAAITAIMGKVSVPSIELCSSLNVATGDSARPYEPQEEAPIKKIDYRSLFENYASASKNISFSGKVFYLPHEGVNTDDIIPAIYLNEAEKKAFKPHCLETIVISEEDRKELESSQVIVSMKNFGDGSSREQAPWAFEAVGVKSIIASSFVRIFRENMFNNGFLCAEISEKAVNLLFEERPEKVEIIWDTEAGKPGFVIWGENKEEFFLTENEKKFIREGGITSTYFQLAAELQEEGKI